MQLPSAAQLQRIVLACDQGIRGSGDDLKCFYYYLRHEDNWLHRQAVGRRLPQQFATRWGGEASLHYRLAFRVWGMGDVNACDVAQATNEAVLARGGALPPNSQLKWGDPSPEGDLWSGV